MNSTIYRYKILGANWGEEVITESFLIKISELLLKQPFMGREEELSFGFTQCGYLDGKVYGLFIQNFLATLINYDPITKEEIKTQAIDCGEYLFILNLKEYEVFLQTKKSADLPSREEINKRFVTLLNQVLYSISYGVREIVVAEEEVDRDKIVKIFYEKADRVLELELNDFDVNIINQEKEKRDGKRQTYFNPKEEYQEAMEESAIKLSEHAESASIKAKDGESLKKDPISRAMLEASRKPVKIVYVSEHEQHTEYGVNKSKDVITIEGDSYNLEEQSEIIFSHIFGGTKNNNRRNQVDDREDELF